MTAPTRTRMLDMNVSRLTVDPLTNMPLVILSDADGKEAVPIWIGVPEASAIASQLEKVELERPATHDLLKSVIGHCGLSVERVEVRDVREHTYYAAILLRREEPAGRKPRRATSHRLADDGALIELDSRPSDAIALALRTGARILVARKVIDKTRKLGRAALAGDVASKKAIACGGEPDVAAARSNPEILHLLSDEDFGKWKM